MPPDSAPRRPKPRFSLTASVVRGPQAQTSTPWGSSAAASPNTGCYEQGNTKKRRLEDGRSRDPIQTLGRASSAHRTDHSADAGPSSRPLPPSAKRTSRLGVAAPGRLSSTFENGSRLPSSSLPPSSHVPRQLGNTHAHRAGRNERRVRGSWSRPPTEELMDPRGWRMPVELRMGSPTDAGETTCADDGGLDVTDERAEDGADRQDRSPSIEFMGTSVPHPEPPPAEERSLPRQSLPPQSPFNRSSERRSLPQSSPAPHSLPRRSLPRSPPPMSPGSSRDELHRHVREPYDHHDVPFHNRDRLDRVRRDVAWILQPPASPAAPPPPFQAGFPPPFPQPIQPQTHPIWPPPAVPNAIYKHPAVYPDYPPPPAAYGWGGWDGSGNAARFPIHQHQQPPLWPNQSGYPMPPPSRQGRPPPPPAEYRAPVLGEVANYMPARPPPPPQISPTAPVAAPRRAIRIPTANGYRSPSPAPLAVSPPANVVQEQTLLSPAPHSQPLSPPTPSASLSNSQAPTGQFAESAPTASSARVLPLALAPASPPPPSSRARSGTRKTNPRVRKPPTPAWELDASDSDGESHLGSVPASVDQVSAQGGGIQIMEHEETSAVSPAPSPRARSTRTRASKIPGEQSPVAALSNTTLRKRPRARQPPTSAWELDDSELESALPELVDASVPSPGPAEPEPLPSASPKLRKRKGETAETEEDAEDANKPPKRRTRQPPSPAPARRSLPKRAARPSSNMLREGEIVTNEVKLTTEPTFRDADLDAGDDTYKPKGWIERRRRQADDTRVLPAASPSPSASPPHDAEDVSRPRTKPNARSMSQQSMNGSSPLPSPSKGSPDEDATGLPDTGPITDASRLSRRRIPSSPLSSVPDETGDVGQGNMEAGDSASSFSPSSPHGSTASSLQPLRHGMQSAGRQPPASPSPQPRGNTHSPPQSNPPPAALPAASMSAGLPTRPSPSVPAPTTESAEGARPIAPRPTRPIAVRPNTSKVPANARTTAILPTSNAPSNFDPTAHWDVPSVAEGLKKSLKPVWKLHQPRPEVVQAKRTAAGKAAQQGVAAESSRRRAEVIDLTSPERGPTTAVVSTRVALNSSRDASVTSSPPPRTTSSRGSQPPPAALTNPPALSHPDIFNDLTFAFVGETFLDKFLGPLSKAIELRQGRVYPIKAILEDSRVKVDYLLFPHPNQARYGINAKLDRIDAQIVNGHQFNWARCALIDDRWVFKAITTGVLPPALDAASITSLLAAHKAREAVTPGEEQYVELVIAELRRFGWRYKARIDFFGHFRARYPTKTPSIESMVARYSGMLEDACPAFARAPVSHEGLETPREPSLEDDGIEILDGPDPRPPHVGDATASQTQSPRGGMDVDLTVEAEDAATAVGRTQPDPGSASISNPAAQEAAGEPLEPPLTPSQGPSTSHVQQLPGSEAQGDVPSARPGEPVELSVATEGTSMGAEEPSTDRNDLFPATEGPLPEEQAGLPDEQPTVPGVSPGRERPRALSMNTEESAVSRVMDIALDSPAAAAASLEETSSPPTAPAPLVEAVTHLPPNPPDRVLGTDEERTPLTETETMTNTGSEDRGDVQPSRRASATTEATVIADSAGTCAPAAEPVPGSASSTVESSPYGSFIVGVRAATVIDSSPFAAQPLVPGGQAHVLAPAVPPPADAGKSKDMSAEGQSSTIAGVSASPQVTRRFPTAPLPQGPNRGSVPPMPQRAPIKFVAIAPRPAPHARNSDPGPGPATEEAVAVPSALEPPARQADQGPHWGQNEAGSPRPVIFSSVEEYTEALAREEEGIAARQRREQVLAEACEQLLAREREKEMERLSRWRRPRKQNTTMPQPSVTEAAPARRASAPAEGLERNASTIGGRAQSVTANDVSTATAGVRSTTAATERASTPSTPPPPMPAGVHLVTDREGDVSLEQRVSDRKKRRDRVRAKAAAKRGDDIPDWGDYDFSEPESEEE